MSEEKQYYCQVKAEFGRIVDGKKVPKNPTTATWLDLEYGEAVAFQTLVIRPMVNELVEDSLEMGIIKAVEEGTMTNEVAKMLLAVLNKEESKRG